MKVRFAVAPGVELVSSGDVIALANALEASEFDGVWLSDVPFGPLLDPLLGLALIAGRTSRLRLGANVVPLGRNPFLLAKELAQLDRLSGGRCCSASSPGSINPVNGRRFSWAPRTAAWCSRRFLGCCARGGSGRRSSITRRGGRSPL